MDRKGYRIIPDEAGTLFNGACLYAKAGYTDKAINMFEQAFTRGYGNKHGSNRIPTMIHFEMNHVLKPFWKNNS